MNAIELTTFDKFVLDLKISPFDNSSNCVAVLTRDKIIIGLITNDKDFKWKLFKEIKLQNTASAFAFSPISRTTLFPMFVRLSYSDKNGVYSVNVSENGDELRQTILKVEIDATSMSHNKDGVRIALTGGDKLCRILSYQNDCLSECDSMVSDAVGEGSYDQFSVRLASEGQCVLWHNKRDNYLVVAELSGVIRFLTCVVDGDRETFICEYSIDMSLRLPVPMRDLDIIYSNDKTSHDFIVATPAGLFMFALDKPLSTVEKLSNGSGVSGNRLVRMSRSWGRGSLLATVYQQGQIVVTDIGGSRVISCPMTDCVALQWHKSRPMLLAASASVLLGVEFHEFGAPSSRHN